MVDTGVSGNSRSRPFSGMRVSDSRSQSLGMSFSFPFPFPKVGNAFFDSRSRSQNLGMQFSIPVPVNWNGLSRREWNGNGVQKLGFRGLLTDTIDPLDISLGYPWRIHHNKWKLGQPIPFCCSDKSSLRCDEPQ